MPKIRDYWNWIIGSVLAAIAIAVGWLIESGIALSLISLLIGAGITYFITTRVQRRVWKREYAIKVVEEIYGKLYDNMKNILNTLEGESYYPALLHEWHGMRDSYKYLMVDETFGKEIDELYDQLSKYSRAVSQIRGEIIPNIARQETEKFFGVKTNEHAKLHIKWKEDLTQRTISTALDITDSLLLQKPPLEWHFGKHEQQIPTLIESQAEILVGNKLQFVPTDVEKFNIYWKSCLKRTNKNPTHQFIRKEKERLIIEVKKLMKELRKRIQEPWKI